MKLAPFSKSICQRKAKTSPSPFRRFALCIFRRKTVPQTVLISAKNPPKGGREAEGSELRVIYPTPHFSGETLKIAALPQGEGSIIRNRQTKKAPIFRGFSKLVFLKFIKTTPSPFGASRHFPLKGEERAKVAS